MNIQIFETITELDSGQWSKLQSADFPFTDYRFLHALETTGCLGPRTGWSPRYIGAFENRQLVGALVCFVKTNSYGEYIFDFAWANAYQNYGMNYYPKMVSAIPFTPATGPKLLVNPAHAENAAIKQLLLQNLLRISTEESLSSTHALFIPEDEISDFTRAGFFLRHSFQYHWKNKEYLAFQSFLTDLRSKRRKEIVRERSQVTESGVKISRLTGAELTAEHATLMYQLYLNTVDKMGGFNYLTPEFFQAVFQSMPEHLLLVLAETANGQVVAGALNYFGNQTLYGRHWGCLDEYRALHFEICYYQGIEFAIQKKFRLFEAGAQGEHKFQRGFMPRLTYSAHQIQEPAMNQAIQDFVRQEKQQLDQLFQEYESHSPFPRPAES